MNSLVFKWNIIQTMYLKMSHDNKTSCILLTSIFPTNLQFRIFCWAIVVLGCHQIVWLLIIFCSSYYAFNISVHLSCFVFRCGSFVYFILFFSFYVSLYAWFTLYIFLFLSLNFHSSMFLTFGYPHYLIHSLSLIDCPSMFVSKESSFWLFHSLLLFLCLSLCLIYTVYLSLFISLLPIALCFLPLACISHCMHSRLFMFIYFCIYWWQFLFFQSLHFLSLCLVYNAYLSFFICLHHYFIHSILLFNYFVSIGGSFCYSFLFPLFYCFIYFHVSNFYCKSFFFLYVLLIALCFLALA